MFDPTWSWCELNSVVLDFLVEEGRTLVLPLFETNLFYLYRYVTWYVYHYLRWSCIFHVNSFDIVYMFSSNCSPSIFWGTASLWLSPRCRCSTCSLLGFACDPQGWIRSSQQGTRKILPVRKRVVWEFVQNNRNPWVKDFFYFHPYLGKWSHFD